MEKQSWPGSMSEWPKWLPIRDDLREISTYGAPQIDVRARLNTNENPYELSDSLVADIGASVQAIAKNLNRYPDRDALELRDALADYATRSSSTKISGEHVWAANGSNEIIQQILQAFGGDQHCAIGFTPSYSMHSIIARSTQTSWIEGHREADFTLKAESAIAQIRAARPQLVFITSPNNPTGTAVSLETQRAILETAREIGALVVIDEAYAEFARAGTKSALTLIEEFPNALVTRTMSKAFAMAGTRVGYLVADPVVIRALMLVRLPYHLSTVTQAVALAALRHTVELLATVDAIKVQRDRIIVELTRMGFSPVPSDANFVLFGTMTDSAAMWRALLARGVLIRDVGLPGLLRVTTGTVAETTAFLEALEQIGQETR
jgi:histidinol-phosphate aminotransferase